MNIIVLVSCIVVILKRQQRLSELKSSYIQAYHTKEEGLKATNGTDEESYEKMRNIVRISNVIIQAASSCLNVLLKRTVVVSDVYLSDMAPRHPDSNIIVLFSASTVCILIQRYPADCYCNGCQ